MTASASALGVVDDAVDDVVDDASPARLAAPRRALAWLIAVVAGCWIRTLRLRLSGAGLPSGPAVFAFWHGQQLAVLAAARHLRLPERRRLMAMVSRSSDGRLQQVVMRRFGIRSAAGSSSRGGASAQRRLIRWLSSGADAVFAADGPRGPLRRAKSGAAQAARTAGAELVPIGCYADRLVRLRAWDRFELPLPFSRVWVVVGKALRDSDAEGLTTAIEDARAAAQHEVSS